MTSPENYPEKISNDLEMANVKSIADHIVHQYGDSYPDIQGRQRYVARWDTETYRSVVMEKLEDVDSTTYRFTVVQADIDNSTSYFWLNYTNNTKTIFETDSSFVKLVQQREAAENIERILQQYLASGLKFYQNMVLQTNEIVSNIFTQKTPINFISYIKHASSGEETADRIQELMEYLNRADPRIPKETFKRHIMGLLFQPIISE